jgi:hypothetical protein
LDFVKATTEAGAVKCFGNFLRELPDALDPILAAQGYGVSTLITK